MQLVAACWRMLHCWAQAGKEDGIRFWAKVGVKTARRAGMRRDFMVNGALVNESRLLDTEVVMTGSD